MGAWAAGGGRKVVAITGDGGFGQYLAEFTTAVKYRMPITHVLLNNSELGKISREQSVVGIQGEEPPISEDNRTNAGRVHIRGGKIPGIHGLVYSSGVERIQIVKANG